MSADLIAYYRTLLQSTGLDMALCWSVVRGLSKPVTIDDVVRRLGGDPSTLRERPLQAAYDEYDPDSPLIHIAQPGPAVMVVENNGFQGSRREVLRELSTDAVVHTIYWHVNGADAWIYAVWRKVLVSIDLRIPEDRWGDDPDCVMSDLDPLLEASDGFHRPAGMAAITVRTGVKLDTEWVARPQLSFFAKPIPADQFPRSPLASGDPDLYAWVMTAAPDRQRRILGLTLSLLGERFGLESSGALARCVSLLEHGERGSAALLEERDQVLQALGADLRADASTPIEHNPPWQRLQAHHAISSMVEHPGNRYGTGGEPFDCLALASMAFAETWPSVRGQLVALARDS